jgi:hypothetical protein
MLADRLPRQQLARHRRRAGIAGAVPRESTPGAICEVVVVRAGGGESTVIVGGPDPG